MQSKCNSEDVCLACIDPKLPQNEIKGVDTSLSAEKASQVWDQAWPPDCLQIVGSCQDGKSTGTDL